MDKEINNILFEIEKEGIIGFTNDDSEQRMKAKSRLEREGFIKPKSKNSYDLTEKGQQAVDIGGYYRYKDLENKKEQKEQKIKDLTLRQLKGNIFQIKFWWLLIIINAIVAILASNFKLILSWLGF
jgi:predicted transcriptional regulator